ncbi:hypothetical protein [Nocardia sp. NPDC050793]|uniref:hypothetical protein n=1 Tax=Nocardia sp. NPDC050793 TaxID=3155159 RepID=UPI00340DF03D
MTPSRTLWDRLGAIADSDGYLTTDDLLGAVHDHYFGDNPDSARSRLLGALPD